MICKICGSNASRMLYHGLIRLGKFGDWSREEHTVHQCEQCQAGFLPLSGFSYEEDEYRQRVESSAALEDFYRLHDREQAEKLGILGTETLRGQVVADIGCGGGSFLDFLYGVAQETIAIEPARSYQDALAQKHRYFQYGADALPRYAGKVDLAGFGKVVLRYVQRFDLSNALHWIKDHRPTGLGRTPWCQGLDGVFSSYLEGLGKSDFL